MKKKVVAFITISAFIVGLILEFWFIKVFFSAINDGLLIWMYYFFQIFGGIGICLAVVVALFKDSIKTLLWHPEFCNQML